MNCRVASLFVYPVKSMAGIQLHSAKMLTSGIEGDRQFMVVDDEGRFVSQRQYPRLACVHPEVTSDFIRLHYSGSFFEADLKPDVCHTTTVKVWNDVLQALLVGGKDFSDWLNWVIQPNIERRFRFARAVGTLRPVKRDYLGKEIAEVAFADRYPYLIVSKESTLSLQSAASIPIDVECFRPNIVIEGLPAYSEEAISVLCCERNNLMLGLRRNCQRCGMVNIQQSSGLILFGNQPLRSITSRQTNGSNFGRLTSLIGGTGEILNVGDTLLARNEVVLSPDSRS